MREMKNSIVPGIERIPSAWEVVPLKSKFSFGKGLSITKSDLIESGIPVLSYGQIHSKKNKRTTIDDSLLRFVPKWKILSSPDSRAIQNGFIFADTSEDRDGCGNCNYVDKDGLYAGYHTIVLKPKTNENWKYLGYLFQTDAWRYQFRRDLTEVKLYSVSQKILKNSYIFVPPKEERAAIADFLDRKCAEIDSLTADVQNEIETLQEYRRSLITEAVTKGLDPDVEMKDSGIEWVGSIPSHWDVMANKYIMSKLKVIKPSYRGEDILSLTINGVIVRDLDAGGKMPSSFNGYQTLFPGNLLMCLFDYDVTPRCIGLIKNQGVTSPAYSQFFLLNDNHAPYYYYYYLMIDYTKELLHLAKNLRHSFTEDQLGAIPTPVPPVDEQHRIATFLDEKCTEIDSIIEVKQKQLETLAEYRKSLIYEYVTGKKEVV